MRNDRDRKNDNNNRILVLTLLLTFAMVVGGVFSAYNLLERRHQYTISENTSASENIGYSETNADDVDASGTEAYVENNTSAQNSLSLDVTDVVKKAMPSIVAITNRTVQEVSYMFRGTMEIESESTGSGIIIGQSETELLIATNYHVIENATTLTVCFSVEAEDAIVEAVLKGSDEENDLAVIAVTMDTVSEAILGQIAIAELGSSEELMVGEPAIAIGNALGYGQSVTRGIISALNRTIEVDGVTRNYIQTDAAINSGNSGGALLNENGEVIGINSAKVSSSGVEGMGYAIPIDDAKPILTNLMDRETREKAEEDERGYLGVYTQDISSEARSLYDIPNGVYVSYVVSDSPAEKAGLKSGDIINALDEVTVTSTDGFEELLEYYRADETVEIEFLRSDMGSYTSQTVSVTFASQPEGQETPSPNNNAGPFGGTRPFN